MKTGSAADIHGPWVETGSESGLIDQARQWWPVPVPDLPDAPALFLRQEIAVDEVLKEAPPAAGLGPLGRLGEVRR